MQLHASQQCCLSSVGRPVTLQRRRCQRALSCVASSSSSGGAGGGGSGEGSTDPESRNPGGMLKAVWVGAEAFGNVVGASKAAGQQGQQQRAVAGTRPGTLSREEAVAAIRKDYDVNYFISGTPGGWSAGCSGLPCWRRKASSTHHPKPTPVISPSPYRQAGAGLMEPNMLSSSPPCISAGAGDMSAYAPDCLFADPFAGFNGVGRFQVGARPPACLLPLPAAPPTAACPPACLPASACLRTQACAMWALQGQRRAHNASPPRPAWSRSPLLRLPACLPACLPAAQRVQPGRADAKREPDHHLFR